MAAGQPLRGFAGQSMNGQRPLPGYYATSYPPGSYTFTAPAPGQYLFVLWGPGGGGQNLGNSGASGGYCEYSRWMGYGEAVTLAVTSDTTATTATFVGGKVVTAGAAILDAPGSASGGDLNYVGTAGGTPGGAGQGTGGGAAGAGGTGGSGAPGRLPFRGGAGSTSPGGGAVAATATIGGCGLILVMRAA